MTQHRHIRQQLLSPIVFLASILAGASITSAVESDHVLARRTPVVEVFAAAKDTVVNISSTQIVEIRSPFGLDQFFEDVFDLPRKPRQFKQTSVGSGFILHPAGYIVTNAHVIARTVEQKIIFADKREFDAQIVAVDHENDLAVLKIDTPEPLLPIKLGHSGDLMVGETVIAIGNPLGYQNTVTAGVISALDRTLELNENLSFHGLIQTDASINPGNSGGPLLNVLGELIGINTAIRGDAQNIGFAIPVDKLRRVLPDLMDVERRYNIYTGLRVRWDTPSRVENVVPDSPAEHASIRINDVITHVDDQPIKSGLDLHILLIGKHPGDSIRLRFHRLGRERSTTLTLAQRSRPDGADLLALRFGIKALPLNRQMVQALGIRGLTGLLVTYVEPNSPADRVQFQKGDILIHIGRHQAASLEDVGELLEHVRAGQRVRATILRVNGRTIFRVSAELRAR